VKKLRLDCHLGKRKSLAVMRTVTSHITNLFTGVSKVGLLQCTLCRFDFSSRNVAKMVGHILTAPSVAFLGIAAAWQRRGRGRQRV